MENILETKDIMLSKDKGSLTTHSQYHESQETISYSRETLNTNLSTSSLIDTFEDTGKFIDNLFVGRQFISNEAWKSINTIQGRISSFTKTKVFVDCLIDSTNKIFEHREFPFFLFEHLNNVEENKPVLIKTRINPGSSRIDIYPGEGIVNGNLFEINDKWELLRDSGLDERLF